MGSFYLVHPFFKNDYNLFEIEHSKEEKEWLELALYGFIREYAAPQQENKETRLIML